MEKSFSILVTAIVAFVAALEAACRSFLLVMRGDDQTTTTPAPAPAPAPTYTMSVCQACGLPIVFEGDPCLDSERVGLYMICGSCGETKKNRTEDLSTLNLTEKEISVRFGKKISLDNLISDSLDSEESDDSVATKSDDQPPPPTHPWATDSNDQITAGTARLARYGLERPTDGRLEIAIGRGRYVLAPSRYDGRLAAVPSHPKLGTVLIFGVRTDINEIIVKRILGNEVNGHFNRVPHKDLSLIKEGSPAETKATTPRGKKAIKLPAGTLKCQCGKTLVSDGRQYYADGKCPSCAREVTLS